jgi:streptomycin 6-kinase
MSEPYFAVCGRPGHSGGMLQVPETLAERASQDVGARGGSWIGQLPETIAAVTRRWSLTPHSVLPSGKELSLVIAVTTAAGSPAVLKASYPDARPRHEAAALARWAGNGAAALLRADPVRGLLLLEQLACTSLRAEDDATAVPVAGRMLRQLWVAPGQHSFPEQADRVSGWLTLIPGQYRQLGSPFEPELLHAAMTAARHLTVGSGLPVLLHGDFHRGNVLASARAGWLAIDPCPLVGDPEFDIADLAADLAEELVGQPGAAGRLAAVLSDLCRVLPRLDSQRIRDWMLAKRVILALDNLAATGNAEWDLTFARLLADRPAGAAGLSGPLSSG